MTTGLVLNKIVYTNREILVWLCLLKKIMLPISRFLRLHSATWHYDTGGTGTLCSSTEWKIPDKSLSWKCGFDFCCLLKKHSQQKLDGTRYFFFTQCLKCIWNHMCVTGTTCVSEDQSKNVTVQNVILYMYNHVCTVCTKKWSIITWLIYLNTFLGQSLSKCLHMQMMHSS